MRIESIKYKPYRELGLRRSDPPRSPTAIQDCGTVIRCGTLVFFLLFLLFFIVVIVFDDDGD